MPHLSPMNWIFMSLFMWMILLLISSSFWWMQSPSFQTPVLLKSPSKLMSSQWKWSL